MEYTALFKRIRISRWLILMLVLCVLFFVYSLFSARSRSNQEKETQLRLIMGNLQLENRVVFGRKESLLRLEAKMIESGKHGILTGKADIASLKNLIDVMEKVAAIGIISEDGEEFAIQKRNNLYATYYYRSAADSLADFSFWDGYEKRDVPDTNVGNRMYHEGIFRMHAKLGPGQLTWHSTTDLPGIATRRGLSASILTTDTLTGKKYIVVFFVPFKRLMTNTVKVGYGQGKVFIFNKDSLYFNFNGTKDSASGFDTTTYFVPWKDIPVKSHQAALKTWESLGNPDSVQVTKFESEGSEYWAAFSPFLDGRDGTYYALIVSASSLPTLVGSGSGTQLLIAFCLLLIAGVVFAIAYAKIYNRVRFVPLNHDEVQKMISRGESDLLEFKSTIRFNLHTGKPGKEIELAWLKSVVAFCNTEGGTILIGVKDTGEILGLGPDLFQNDDKCLLHIQNLISEHVGVEYLAYVRFHLMEFGDKKILVIQCIPLKRIMLLKSAGKEQFYVRSGPSSIELPMSKVLEYVNERNKKF